MLPKRGMLDRELERTSSPCSTPGSRSTILTLKANIWTNPNPGQDGYVDDVHGWNFVSNNNDPTDDYGHGTHVAGIIGAVGNNGLGVTGVNWSVSLMPLKICNAEGSCFLSDEIAALEYAVNHGAKVANASFGGDYGGYQPEEEAIQAAGKAGLLYVAAAGNSASDNDDTPFYPASYPLENIVSVAATTSSDTLASFSDYGLSSVELGAPGQSILSTLPTSGTLSSSTGYGELSGTSMATPQVSGAAALLLEPAPLLDDAARPLATARDHPAARLARRRAYRACGELDVGVATAPGPPERASVCVTRIGTGSGSVTSSPAGIDCGASCSATFAPGDAGDADCDPGSRLDLRRLARGLHGDGLVHRLADDGHHRSPHLWRILGDRRAGLGRGMAGRARPAQAHRAGLAR